MADEETHSPTEAQAEPASPEAQAAEETDEQEQVAVHDIDATMDEPEQLDASGDVGDAAATENSAGQVEENNQAEAGTEEQSADGEAPKQIPAVSSAPSTTVVQDEDSRKLFVGGLSRDTTEKGLKDYFEKFGDVVSAIVKIDPTTHIPRGFGFVTFVDNASVEKVTRLTTHTLDGRTIDPKLAVPQNAKNRVKKIFVGGLPADLDEPKLREYFDTIGKVDEVDIPIDRNTNRRRGFCFISFESEEIVDQIVAKGRHEIGEHTVEVKKATPKDQSTRGGMRGGFHSSRGRGGSYSSYSGGGGGGGGYGGGAAYSASGGGSGYGGGGYGGGGYAGYGSYGNSGGYGGGYGGYGNYGAYGGYGNYGAYGYDYSQQYSASMGGGDSSSRYGPVRTNYGQSYRQGPY